MIELSLDLLDDITYVMNAEDDRTEDFATKHNISIDELEDIVDDYIDKSYIENHIYHIVPLATFAILGMNLFAMLIS